MTGTDDADPISYEAARTELAEIVKQLESGGQSLEESLALWERGERLADLCQQWLDGAAARLDEAIAAHDADDAGPRE
ncbi:MAG: exodeoxyribonuclease VII small subunit [Actinobacteria bacterium]|nr:exodeoxyribonuclease VII small subunit [Actinomycetota bacterium]